MAFGWFYDAGLLPHKRVKHAGSGDKACSFPFLFTSHSSAGRAHHERINEGKTDDLESNKDKEREFLCAAKRG